MATLFKRWARLTIDTIEITSSYARASLRFAFTVHKSLKPEPNKADVTIWNLNPDHRSKLETLKDVAVRIEAGYGENGDDASLLFLGYLRNASTTREGPDQVTRVGSGEGEDKMRKSRVNASVAKGTSTDVVFKLVARAVGVDDGNLNDAAKIIKARFGASGGIFPSGAVVSGNAARELTAICRAADLEWCVHNGKLQFTERGKALAGKAILLSKQSGMIGAPSVDGKGILSVSSLLQPDVYPGRLLVLHGEHLKGQYKIEETDHTGDTSGEGEWSVAIKAARY